MKPEKKDEARLIAAAAGGQRVDGKLQQMAHLASLFVARGIKALDLGTIPGWTDHSVRMMNAMIRAQRLEKLAQKKRAKEQQRIDDAKQGITREESRNPTLNWYQRIVRETNPGATRDQVKKLFQEHFGGSMARLRKYLKSLPEKETRASQEKTERQLDLDETPEVLRPSIEAPDAIQPPLSPLLLPMPAEPPAVAPASLVGKPKSGAASPLVAADAVPGAPQASSPPASASRRASPNPLLIRPVLASMPEVKEEDAQEGEGMNDVIPELSQPSERSPLARGRSQEEAASSSPVANVKEEEQQELKRKKRRKSKPKPAALPAKAKLPPSKRTDTQRAPKQSSGASSRSFRS